MHLCRKNVVLFCSFGGLALSGSSHLFIKDLCRQLAAAFPDMSVDIPGDSGGRVSKDVLRLDLADRFTPELVQCTLVGRIVSFCCAVPGSC